MDLKFDKMTVDTTLAKDYILREKQLSEICSGNQDADVFFDGKEYCRSFIFENKETVLNYDEKFENFAVKLQENTNLLAQLDYLTRGVPIEDTKAQINLIVQQAYYMASKPELHKPIVVGNKCIPLHIDCNTPVFTLGYIVKFSVFGNYCCIHVDKSCAAVCHLFTKIWNDAGLTLYTTFLRDPVNKGDQYIQEGTVGVISELSDIDSAVDVFLTSSKQVPWRLRRILVQESVYQQFINAITWKCNLYKQRENTISSNLEYDGRVFLIDPVGTSEHRVLPVGTPAVSIEAYRTRKELKSLLNANKPHFLSLWANDIAEINEITHSIPASVVWVNNFGDFRGPPRISEALYPYVFNTYSVLKDKTLSELAELKQSWQSLDFEARREIVCGALDAYISAVPENSPIFEPIKSSLRKIDSNTPGAFVDVGKDKVWLGIPAPSNKLFIRQRDVVRAGFLKSVLLGNAFVTSEQLVEAVEMVDALRKAGVPVINITPAVIAAGNFRLDICDCDDEALLEVTQVTKVISTNSGTIFAN